MVTLDNTKLLEKHKELLEKIEKEIEDAELPEECAKILRNHMDTLSKEEREEVQQILPPNIILKTASLEMFRYNSLDEIELPLPKIYAVMADTRIDGGFPGSFALCLTISKDTAERYKRYFESILPKLNELDDEDIITRTRYAFGSHEGTSSNELWIKEINLIDDEDFYEFKDKIDQKIEVAEEKQREWEAGREQREKEYKEQLHSRLLEERKRLLNLYKHKEPYDPVKDPDNPAKRKSNFQIPSTIKNKPVPYKE